MTPPVNRVVGTVGSGGLLGNSSGRWDDWMGGIEFGRVSFRSCLVRQVFGQLCAWSFRCWLGTKGYIFSSRGVSFLVVFTLAQLEFDLEIGTTK